MNEGPYEVPPDAVALGERVNLRLPNEMDRDAFCRLVLASGEHLRRWVLDPAALDDPNGTRWFDSILGANATGRSQKLLVHRIRDRELLGTMNVNEIVRGAFQSASLGYWIGAAHARRGYMSDALAAVLRYVFEAERLHRVEANIQPGNEASIALVRAAGFRQEGYSPRYLKVTGAWRDHERWALTVEDWRDGDAQARHGP